MKLIIFVCSLMWLTVSTITAQTFNIENTEQLLKAIADINAAPDADYTLCIAPGVYWLDDPDDPTVRRSDGGTPFAATIRCNSIRIIGTDPDAVNTVLAVNRGQTHGAIGNFTMFQFRCRKIHTENITYGNYCNVDLDYPLRPELSRKKRAEAVVQAQLAVCVGSDSVVARNCRFISRLNLCNFIGARNAVFECCHMECTDDALAEGTYNKCHLTFYSSKPFYSTSRGAWFNDCDIDIKTQGTQYFTKVPGPIHLKDVRLHCDHKVSLAWCKENHPELCSAENVTLNGKPVKIDDTPYVPLPQVHERIDGRKVEDGYVYVFDAFKPKDTASYSWQPDTSRETWYWGTAPDGAEGLKGFVQSQRGARIHITPDATRQPIHAVTLEVAPCKSAGQGFGSATGQYMDVCIAMDMQTLSGYGLRIERTPDYDHAVEVSIVEYREGMVSAISERQKCELFRTPCTINVSMKKETITATLKHDGKKQTLTAKVAAATSGKSFMLQHTGTVGGGATLIESIEIK